MTSFRCYGAVSGVLDTLRDVIAVEETKLVADEPATPNGAGLFEDATIRKEQVLAERRAVLGFGQNSTSPSWPRGTTPAA